MLGINSVLGLPLHVLVVHFAVVLVPLAAVAFLATAWRQQWRERYSPAVVLLALAGAASAFLAAQSGGSLRRSLRNKALSAGTPAKFGDHPGNGNLAEIFAILFALTAVSWFVLITVPSLRQVPRWATNAVSVAASGLGVLAIMTMIVAGHSGATLVWKDLGNYVTSK